MNIFNSNVIWESPTSSKYCRMSAILILFALFFSGDLQAQGQCSGITFSFDQYEPCRYRAEYSNTSECFIEIRYILESGQFATWGVNGAAGFTAQQISPSEIWIHHTGGFIPLGGQVPLFFTLPNDLNTTMNIAYLDDCAQVGCDLFGGIPIESCPDPQNASIIGVKYKECGGLPFNTQTPLSGWMIQLLDADGNVIDEQETAVDGSYGFYDLPAGVYVVREVQQPGWTANVPPTGQTTVDLSASQQRITNFGNCPPQPPPCDCPAGTLPGGNAVVNGNFSGSSVTTSYTLNNTPALQPGQYWIGSNPSAINAGFANCGDHTTGSGNMMVVNGAPNQNTTIWSQTFTMAPNSTYKFEAWLAALSSASPAQLSVFFLFPNLNVQYEVQRVFAPVTTCTWERICHAWTNGPNTNTVTIFLVNQNAATTGNDFAIDAISFRKCTSPIISGVIYRECDSLPYTDQPVLSGWTVQLLDSMDNLISEQVTDSSGAYEFHDLPPGNYVVKAAVQLGWTPNFPVNGQILVKLDPGESVMGDFGFCEECAVCPPPGNFTVTPVSATEVEVSWDPQSVACGDQVCVWTWWEDADGLLHKVFFYYQILPTMDSHLFPVEPGFTNHIFAITVCDSMMSVSTDTVVYYYPCFGGYTNCPGNLLINGGFEGPGSAGLPNAADQIGLCAGWQAASNGAGVTSIADWYSDGYTAPGFWPGLYNDVPNQQYTYLHASCLYRYAGFDLNTCEGITTQLTSPIGIGSGYTVGFWWSPKEPVTSNFTFLAILSGANCTVNTANGGTACTHQCGGDFHVPVTATPANLPGTWYFHSFTANAPMTVNHLTFAAKQGGPIINNYIYVDEVCVRHVWNICNVGKPKIAYNSTQPHAFFGEADLGPGSTLVSAVWDFGDGTQDSSCCLGSVIHDFMPGTYEVCLTVTAMDSSGMTCSNSTCIPVEITTQSTKCDHVATFLYPSFIGDCCFSLNTNNIEPNCFTQLDITLSSGSFVNTQFGSNWNVAISGNVASLTPAGGGFIPIGQDIPLTICDPLGLDPYSLDIDFVYAGGVCQHTIDFSCGANCECLGFTNLQFITLSIPPLPPVPVDCENTTPVVLPCVANDVLYNFEGNFGCTNECVSSVHYQFFDQNQNQIQYGQANYDSGLDVFNLNPGFKFVPGTYQLVLTGLCGTNDTCICTVNFTIPDCPCCSEDLNDFIQTVDNATNISEDATNCKATLNIGNLPCQQIEWIDWGDGILVNGPFLSGAMPMHNYAHSGPYIITYRATEINPLSGAPCYNNLFTETIQMDCNCACGTFDMEIRLGGALNQPVVCGQTVNLNLNQGFAFYPKFQCQGNYCPPTTQVDWTLTGPGTNLIGTETTTPGAVFTILPVNPGQFTTPGLYILTMTGHCDQNLCPCVITFNVQDPCCTDQAAFLVAAAAVNTFGTLGTCTLSFQAVGLNNCMRIRYDWGDNTSSGPFGDNVLETHTYAATGTYNVCTTIEEVDFFGNVCWTYQSCEDVYVICNDCVCGSFSEMYARPTVGAQSIALSCGSSYNFSCPNPGFSIPITGKFECQGGNCASLTQINWTLTGPSGSHSGTVQAGPYFYLPILPTQYAGVGTYTLTLVGNCGGQACSPCVIKFTVNCPDPCPCDLAQLQIDVNKGFANALSITACKGCFSPIALNDCDMVQWSINGGPVIGMTNGSGSFCHIFPSSGSYVLTMTVIRKKGDGTICGQASISKTVNITCINWADCNSSVFKNRTFSEGAVSGGLNDFGASTGWKSLSGNPEVVEGAAGSTDGWTIQLRGKLDTSDVLTQIDPICLEKSSGMITFRIARSSNSECCPSLDTVCCPLSRVSFGCKLNVQLFRGDLFVLEYPYWNPIRCLSLISLDLPSLGSDWVEVQLPYDVSDWDVVDICGDVPHGLQVRPVIYVTNQLGSEQGETSTRSGIQIDNFCMDGVLVGIKDLPFSNSLRIFPNPNTGTFTVELPEAAKSGMRFSITDLAGRLVQEQATEQGGKQQTVQAGLLPNGLYFLQVVAEGKVLAVEKFVKQ